MLFVHQIPKTWQDQRGHGAATPTRSGQSGDPRLSSRGRRSGTAAHHGLRRPSSAVGSGGEAPHRRTHGTERISAPPSRPGSANSGSARFAGVLRTASPPTSARSLTPDVQTGSSGARASLPSKISSSSNNRPRTPSSTSQRRDFSTGSAVSRPDTGVLGQSQENAMSGSQKGNNGLTTVISSALDYKRFLDRRKQMIQQQVESAQQASSTRKDQADTEADFETSSRAVPDTASAGTAGTSGEARGAGGAIHSGMSSGATTTGWSPGATGPVKASHAMAAAAAAAAAAGGGASDPARFKKSSTLGTATTVAGSSASMKGHSGGTGGGSGEVSQLDDPGTPTSARSCGSSNSNANQLMRRVCAMPQTRAQTPTRYTQSSGAPGSFGSTNNDLNSSGRSSRVSLPAGGAHQVCRSLGQTAQAEMFGGSASKDGNEEMGDFSGRQKQRDSSLDALIRDNVSDGRGSTSTTLSGSSLEDYIIGKQIGQGAYAIVAFGLHKESSKKVAIKIYEKYKLLDPQRRKSVRCEIRLMEQLRHPNIVVFHEALDTPKQIYLIMDFVGGGSLHHFLKKRPNRRTDDVMAKRLFYQVSQGIRYLHDRYIVHRDVKLENLLLDEQGTVKIIDFGFSTIVPPGKKLKIFCGTPSYMAPEIVARKEYAGFCADIWAMGVLLYALLCGSFPFRGQNDKDLYRKIVRGVFNVPEFVSEGARAVLNRALTTEMSRRPTVDDLLADPWLASHKEDAGKAAEGAYKPNSSTSSTATTAAPSSSTGQSARESSGESPAALRAPPAPATPFGASVAASGGVSSSVVRSRSADPRSVGDKAPAGSGAAAVASLAAAAAANSQGLQSSADKRAQPSSATSCSEECRPTPCDAAGTPAADVSTQPSCTGTSSTQERGGERYGRKVEEEAINKLERLGYPRDEIVRQLKDESSHLCKLYHRFLKALTAWDNKPKP
eukprot:TRINITY_DN1590_c0_g2_i1.p1 TRINITY_DN1590_c0_g2~~TRINITY_DN1590_c0_g2_i1.p1  ORF type:complete len:961 (-),score=170.56 TRINITY_DN1590_c0_g2_i1:214-3060(-)